MSAKGPKKTAVAKPKSKGPSEIAPGVYVGGWKDALAFQGARFCVLDEAPDDLPKPTTHIPIYDEAKDRADPRSLDRLAREMQAARARGESVLVFCGHGVRRSPLGGVWFLRRSEGLSLGEAYDRVQAARPKVERADEWLGNARELETS